MQGPIWNIWAASSINKKGILYPKKRQLKFQHPLFKLFVLKILQQNTFLLIFHEGAASEIQTDVLSRLEIRNKLHYINLVECLTQHDVFEKSFDLFHNISKVYMRYRCGNFCLAIYHTFPVAVIGYSSTK